MTPIQNEHQNRTVMRFLFALTICLIVLAFIVSSPAEILAGLSRINFGLCQLFTDFVAVGGLGATLVNIALVMLFELALFWVTKTTISGPHLSILLMTAGFAFFGTSLFNMIPIVLGVFLYARLLKVPFNSLFLQAFMGSAIGPLVNQIAFGLGLIPPIGIPLGIFGGVLVGLVFPPLSSSFSQFHKGYNLYNIGFTAGIIGLIAVAVLRMLKFQVETVSVFDTEHGLALFLLALAIFLSFLVFGLIVNRGNLRDYPNLLSNSGRSPSDFVALFGMGLTLFNMGLMGLMSLAFLKIVGGPVNGPIIGTVLSVGGFAAMGKHPRNTLPVMAGASLAALLHGDIHAAKTLVAILFSTTLAPLSGEYGIFVGLLAGYLHLAVVSNVVFLHGGLNLYNNGFSGGFVAAFLAPLLEVAKQIRGKTLTRKTP